jgi:hypothetical protein
MDRGVTTFPSEELSALLESVDWDMITDSLAERLRSELPKDASKVRIFLSEDEAEKLLDSVDIEKIKADPRVKNAYELLQNFLTDIRSKTEGLPVPPSPSA